LVGVLNWLAVQIETLINKLTAAASTVSKFLGLGELNLPQVELGKFSFVAHDIPEAIAWQAAYTTATEQSAEATKTIVGWLREQAAAAKAVLKGEEEAVNNKERLLALMDDLRKKREQEQQALQRPGGAEAFQRW
jgi:hypothetical protein